MPKRPANISTGVLGVGCGGQPKEGALKARQAACPWQPWLEKQVDAPDLRDEKEAA